MKTYIHLLSLINIQKINNYIKKKHIQNESLLSRRMYIYINLSVIYYSYRDKEDYWIIYDTDTTQIKWLHNMSKSCHLEIMFSCEVTRIKTINNININDYELEKMLCKYLRENNDIMIMTCLKFMDESVIKKNMNKYIYCSSCKWRNYFIKKYNINMFCITEDLRKLLLYGTPYIDID